MWRHACGGRRVCEIGIGRLTSRPLGATAGHTRCFEIRNHSGGLWGREESVDLWSDPECSPEAAANPWLDDEPRDRDQGASDLLRREHRCWVLRSA